MTLRSVDSERKQSAKSQDTTAPIEEGLARLRRVHRLKVRYPRFERLCKPQHENFWVIGGRPGSFKTGLLWNLALNAAECRQRILVASLEMTPGQLAILACCKFSGITRDRVERAFMEDDGQIPFTQEERNLWDSAAERFRGLRFTMRLHGAESGRGTDDVLRAATEYRFDGVFVDHLGMIGRGRGNELEVLSTAIDRLRGLSRGEVLKDYRPWVVATSQLNREIDKGDDERIPRMSDFRGSARIEHDADVVIGLQKRRTKEKREDDPMSLVDGFVLKNRNGPEPEVLLFEANGATMMVTERHGETQAPPPSFHESAEREPGEEG